MCLCHPTRRHFLTAGATLMLPGALAGCDEARVLVSEQEAAAMGEAAWAQIREETPATTDANFAETVAAISQRLLTTAGQSPADWEVVAFDSPQINAFALPGRKIGVFRGIYEVSESPDQLAAVIGHEIGHLEADHARERMGNQRAQGFIAQLVALFLRSQDIQFDREIMAVLGVGMQYGLALPYSRGQELEADRLGLVTMAEAGYDPGAAIAFWQRMEAAAGQRGPEITATHPAPASRIRELQDMLPEVRRL